MSENKTETGKSTEEMTPEEYAAYKKGSFYDSVASSLSWIALVITLACCHYCTK